MATATLTTSNVTPRIEPSLDSLRSTPSRSATNTAHPFASRSAPPTRLPDAHAEFANEAALFLSGSWMKKRKPPASRQGRGQTSAVSTLSRISESSASHRRSRSSRDTTSRPPTGQTMSHGQTSAPPSPVLSFKDRLTPFSSNPSLRSSEEPPIPRKKNKLLSFKIMTPRLPSHNTSPQRSPVASSFPRSVEQELDEACAVEQAMDQLPPNLKPAAAKLLGIEIKGLVSAKSSICPSPVVASSGQRSRSAMSTRPHSPSGQHPERFARPSRLNASSSLNSFASESTTRPRALSPITGLARPEHPLEAEARRASSVTTSPVLHNMDSYFAQPSNEPPQGLMTTFYSSSSDEEDEEDQDADEDGLRSSGYSLASSQTSYGLTSPPESEPKLHNDGDWSARQRIVQKTQVINGTWRRSPDGMAPHNTFSHQPQSSTSSTSSYQTNRSSTTSSTGVVRSFSRPFNRPPPPAPAEPQADFTHPRPAPPRPAERAVPGAIGVADGQPVSQLAAIRESSPEPPEAAVRRDRHLGDLQPRGHRRQISGSRRLQRPRPADADLQRYEQTTDQISSSSLPAFPSPVMAAPRDRRSARPLSLALQKKPEATISAASAEAMILRILECLDSFHDLHTGAMLNKGFLTVYKKNELRLLKNSLRNMSPAQWELREASPKQIIVSKNGGKPDYTPKLYVQFHRRDTLVVQGLKAMLHRTCQTQLRSETVAALSEKDPAKSVRVDDAFWRIWTFCTIFGPDKKKMQDIDSQVDWLQGGDRERERRPGSADSNATSVVSSGSKSRRGQISPDGFGRGNYGGLGLDEMYDMIEIWDCLKSMLNGLTGPGRVVQAKAHGVFDTQRVASGDVDAEQLLLEEWVHWLPTQGLMVVEDMARETNARRATAFTIAQDNDWTTWDAPAPGHSRADFLRDAVDRARAEKATISQKTTTFAEEMPVADRRKSRGLELAAQLREKERGFNLKHASMQEDKDNLFGLWLAWSNKAEGRASPMPHMTKQQPQHKQPQPPPQRPLPNPPLQQSRGSPPQQHQAQPNSGRPVIRSRSSNNSLSLFPSAAKPRMTPMASARGTPTVSPTRSRQNSTASIVRHTDSIEKLKSRAMTQARAQQMSSSLRLDVFPES